MAAGAIWLQLGLGLGFLGGCGDDLPAPLCDVDTQSLANEGEAHAPVGTGLTFDSNPPNSGTHYPLWGRYGTHQQPLERGYYVHNLEHGAVVLLYKCAGACPEITTGLQEVLDSRPVDSACFANVKNRMILTPDPLLDVPVAAAAWRNIYRAGCVDPPSLKAFIQEHYGKGPEDTCSEGQVP
jgi:hypothetical protein